MGLLYLAMFPESPPYSDQPQLCSEGDQEMRQPSYIFTRNTHRVHPSMLRLYYRGRTAGSYRRTRESYETIRQKVGLGCTEVKQSEANLR